MSSSRKIAVIGLGNVLRGDDGFGPAVIRHMESHFAFRPAVDLVDLGAPGIDLSPFLHEVDEVIFVDTAKLGIEAGDIGVLSREELLAKTGPSVPKLSGHESDIYAAIFKAEWDRTGMIEFCMIAAEPEDLKEAPGLSPKLIDAIEPAAKLIVDKLRSAGITVENRTPESTDPWWKNELNP